MPADPFLSPAVPRPTEKNVDLECVIGKGLAAKHLWNRGGSWRNCLGMETAANSWNSMQYSLQVGGIRILLVNIVARPARLERATCGFEDLGEAKFRTFSNPLILARVSRNQMEMLEKSHSSWFLSIRVYSGYSGLFELILAEI